MIKVEVILEAEQVEECFENAEVRYSKAKANKLKKILEGMEPDVKERLEEALMEFIEETIGDEWGE